MRCLWAGLTRACFLFVSGRKVAINFGGVTGKEIAMGKRRKAAGGGRRVEHATGRQFSSTKPAVVPSLENDSTVELEDTRDTSKSDVELTKYKRIYGYKESFMT